MVTAALTSHHMLASAALLAKGWMVPAFALLITLCPLPRLLKRKIHLGPPILAIVSLLAAIAAGCCNPPFYRPSSVELLARESSAVVAIVTFLIVFHCRDLTWLWVWRIFKVILLGGCARVWLLYETPGRQMASFGLFLLGALGLYLSIWTAAKLRAVEPASPDGTKPHELHRNGQISQAELDQLLARQRPAPRRQTAAA